VGKLDQPDFLNCVIQIETGYEPLALLSELQKIEMKMGRTPVEKWGPRIIDLDILFFNEQIINLPSLIIPHKEIVNRGFILSSLNEIAPEFIHPKELKKINEISEAQNTRIECKK
jgi:2-amino-4-hydroxy-6-hydroxymethyldihydropteridine diphosphokinase